MKYIPYETFKFYCNSLHKNILHWLRKIEMIYISKEMLLKKCKVAL